MPPTESEAPTISAPLPVLVGLPQQWPVSERSTLAKTHGDLALKEDALFFAAPPAEIGAIRTAATTMTVGKSLEQIGRRLAGAAMGATLLMVGVGSYLATTTNLHVPEIPLLVGAFVIGSTLGSMGGFPLHSCSYVGQEGVAEFTFGSKSHPVRKQKILSFAKANALRVHTVKHYRNGVYTGTQYNYYWTDDDGKVLLELTGNHSAHNGTPGRQHAYHFVQSAEQAWNDYLFTRYAALLNQGKTVRFGLTKGSSSLALHTGGLEIQQNGKEEKMSLGEIGDVSVAKGWVTITRTDAKTGILGIGKSGQSRFQYAHLGNARVFFALLANLTGNSEVSETES